MKLDLSCRDDLLTKLVNWNLLDLIRSTLRAGFLTLVLKIGVSYERRIRVKKHSLQVVIIVLLLLKQCS